MMRWDSWTKGWTVITKNIGHQDDNYEAQALGFGIRYMIGRTIALEGSSLGMHAMIFSRLGER